MKTAASVRIMRIASLVFLAAALSGCGSDSIATGAPPPASTLPVYKVAATFNDSGGRVTVFESGKPSVTVGRDSPFSEPVWSPDGAKLALTEVHRTSPISSVGTYSGNYALHIWTASGGLGGPLVSVPLSSSCDSRGSCWTFHDVMNPAWSPDGTTLAYRASSSSIGLINADGTNGRTIPVRAGSYGPLRWSPAGRTIAFLAKGPGIFQIVVNVVDATAPFAEKTFFPATGSESVRQFSWSPDGKAMAIGEGKQLVLVSTESATLYLTIGAADVDVTTWSPDGSRIAFGARVQDLFQTNDVFIVNRDGTSLRRVTQRAGPWVNMEWTPDSRSVLFVNGGFALIAADITGGATYKILPSFSLHFSVSPK